MKTGERSSVLNARWSTCRISKGEGLSKSTAGINAYGIRRSCRICTFKLGIAISTPIMHQKHRLVANIHWLIRRFWWLVQETVTVKSHYHCGTGRVKFGGLDTKWWYHSKCWKCVISIKGTDSFQDLEWSKVPAPDKF